MKIPERVIVGGHNISVELKEVIFDNDNSPAMGMAYLIQDRIEVATHYVGLPVSVDNKGMALIHEIIHHIDSVYGIKLKERQVEDLSQGVYQVLKDNSFEFDG